MPDLPVCHFVAYRSVQWKYCDDRDYCLLYSRVYYRIYSRSLAMTDWMTNYSRRVNAERLARQAPEVKKLAEEIGEELKSIEQYLYWAIDPDEKDSGQYFCRTLIEHAHALVDLGHEYHAALKANPPPLKTEENEEEST
jgi:hypothetical protein